MTERKRPPGS